MKKNTDPGKLEQEFWDSNPEQDFENSSAEIYYIIEPPDFDFDQRALLAPELYWLFFLMACVEGILKAATPDYRPADDPNITVYYRQNGIIKKWEDWEGHKKLEEAGPQEPLIKPLDSEESEEVSYRLVEESLKQPKAVAPHPIYNRIQLVQKLLNKKGREELRAEYLNTPKGRKKAIKSITLTIVGFALTCRITS